MAAIDPLLQLGVDVKGHAGVGMADLPHHPFDVEIVGQQRDRDVGAPQAVGRRVGQGRQPLGGETVTCQFGRLTDNLPNALPVEPSAVEIGHQIGLGLCGAPYSPQPVQVLHDCLHKIWAHLDLADAGFGLRVRDAEAGTVRVVDADLTDFQVAELTGPHAASAEDLADDPAADVTAAQIEAQPP